MPSLPPHLRLPSTASKVKSIVLNSLNFYRVHLIVFALTPLITSSIMWGINTEYEIPYIDCLFNCMSAMTVCGLAVTNLSTLSPVQQTILFVQMIIGSPTVVSLIMIIVRRHFFRLRFKHVIEEERKRRSSVSYLSRTMSRVAPSAPPLSALRKKFSKNNSKPDEPPKKSPEDSSRSSDDHAPTPPTTEFKPAAPIPRSTSITLDNPPPPKHKGAKKKRNISTSMIKRVEGGGVGLMNPMGWYDAEKATPINTPAHTPSQTPADTPAQSPLRRDDSALQTSDDEDVVPDQLAPRSNGLGLDNMRVKRRDHLPSFVMDSPPRMNSEEERQAPSNKVPYAGRQLADDDPFPRSRTIAFDDGDDGVDHDRGMATGREGAFFPRTATYRSQGDRMPFSTTTSTFPRTVSLRPTTSRRPDTKLSGFGGFPTPFEIARSLVNKIAPEATKTLTQSLTMPRTATIGRRDTMAPATMSEGVDKEVPYISFAATVGRNSRFTGLTEDQMDELGGVEYRALRLLLYIVAGYIFFLIVAAFIIVAPYIAAQGRYDHVFENQPRLVKIPWFALFQVVSAFSNTGMSLVDLSLLPFQGAYLMNFIMFFLIFAGNTAFPILLRATVWTIYKISPKASRTRETLKFLLDHPRRCFIYLFPSTQTWVLLLVMVSLTLTDWVCFLVLDLGTDVIQDIPVGRRIAAAFVQSAAVRAAGFAIVPIASLAPAVKVLYTVMMYISVYPVALSVRSTNVYEERSLGLYDEAEDEEYESTNEKGAQAVAKYLGWHARRQLAFDIWWLGFALWLICIIERAKLDTEENASWFNIFNLIFELVSGYGTVGLSLGLPYDNFSFSGGLRKLSKLVLIAVMLRGRHRGLPVAIDRAVMLPKDFSETEEADLEETRSRRYSRRGSTTIPDEFLAGLRRGSTSASAPYPARRESDEHPPSVGQRASSPPGTVRSRSGSNAPSSPSTIQFSLPRTSTDQRNRSPVAMRGGALTPVKESSMSRANTRTGDRL